MSVRDAAASATGDDRFDVVGEATGLPVTFNQSTLIKKELDVVGCRNSLHAFEPLVTLLQTGAVDIAPIRTSVRPFSQTVEAMRDLREHPDRNLKVLIEF